MEEIDFSGGGIRVFNALKDFKVFKGIKALMWAIHLTST